MVRSNLFIRLFAAIMLTLGLFSGAAYLLSVPLIEEKAYEIELNASRTILDNIFALVAKIRSGLDDQRARAMEFHKQQLRNVVTLASGYIDYIFGRMQRGEITEQEARRLVFEGLRGFKFGNDDYVWVTDYNSVLQSHPDPAFQGRDASDLKDDEGRLILPTIIAMARDQGEGFHIYPWRRLNTDHLAAKVSYFRDMPQHSIVVGAGTYLTDIDAEVEESKARAIDELRQALHAVKIARTGYVYVFDAANTMIIHPNGNIEGQPFGSLVDSLNGRPISEELKEAADTGRPTSYLWDKPSDPGHYVYKKISWVRHFPGFDWYLASSVYEEELQRSASALANRLWLVAAVILLVGGGLGYWGVGWLTRPLNRLAETAAKVRAGDLNAQSGIVRNDEIGILAAAFDGMIRRLKDNITSLDSRVRERTEALEYANLRLQGAMDQQNRTQKKLAEIENRQRLILDAIPPAIAYVGQDEKVLFANDGWAKLVGRDKNAIVGRSLEESVGRRPYADITGFIRRSWQGEQTTFEYRVTRRDGRLIVSKNSLIPHLDGQGGVVGLYVLSLDITDEQETARKLTEAQRMKAVGQLAGGLAHDFNNLLSIIIGNLAEARDRYAETPGLDAYLEPAQRAGRRGADITSRLLAFSRQQPLKPEPVEVCALVRDVASLLRRSIPTSIDIRVPCQDDQCWAIADQNQLENALINLAINARDAMPDGGWLEIAVSTRSVGYPLTFDEAVPPDEYLQIRIRDNGQGFSPEARARAFEPFFTTKGLGSGLGLSMVYGFVKQSKGFIRLDSQPGAGADITILLPKAEPAAEAEAPLCVIPSADRPWDGHLALVAEDDEDVRHVIRQQVMSLGFSVLEASSGDEAADLIDQIDDIRLLVSDIVMPGLSGIKLARRVRALRPDIRVIMLSGFSIEDGADMDDLVLLRKPWERQDLLNAIGLPDPQDNNEEPQGGAQG